MSENKYKPNFQFGLLLPLFLLIASPMTVMAQTIAEKKSGFSDESQEMTPELNRQLLDINRQLKNSQEELKRLYGEVDVLYDCGSDEYNYGELLRRINQIRLNNLNLENSWREISIRVGQTESYALWHQPETTIGQLVMDYGSQDFVYLMTPEIASIPLSVDSNLLIPRASWGEMLELILVQNGIGFRQLNPYLRQLFFLKENASNIRLITNNRRDLDLFSPDTRISFMLTPEPSEARRTWMFLDKFVNPNSTVLQMIGRDILIIGQVVEVQDLLKLYDFVAANKGDKEYKVFPITRVDVDEMARILYAIFDQNQGGSQPLPLIPLPAPANREKGGFPPQRGTGPKPPPMPAFKPANATQNDSEMNGLRIIPLGHVARALFLVGTKEELRKAEQIIRQVESQVGEAREKVIYWYTAKHSDPEELAEVLYKIYLLMVRSGVGFRPDVPPGFPTPPGFGPPGYVPLPIPTATADQIAEEIIEREIDMLPSELYQTSYYQQGNYIVNPSPIEPRGTRTPTVNTNRENFLVDPKTGSIAMVVEADILPKIKELIKKLDVPKRMVQIEALLFERRVTKQNNFGLNLLRIGDCANNVSDACLNFSDPIEGILNFMLSGAKKCGLPAYDVAYRFLMTQDDIQINASPSVVAINQTPATIAIVEEISINTGIYNVETARGNTLEKAFTRAQYGITISITPTIHITNDGIDDEETEPNYVTLETDITFDTIQGGLELERPDVTRRHITNDVRIPDGQTVILGGLRRKNTEDFKDSIPFLGEVPGIGKLFSMRELQDNEVEMFIFLTPTIISDPLDDFERIKCEEMRRRPGDIPEFLCRLVSARDAEKNRVMAGSMRILFGPDPERCRSPSYWMPTTCGHRGWTDDCSCAPCPGEYYGR